MGHMLHCRMIFLSSNSTQLISSNILKSYPAVLPGVFALLLSSPVALKVRPKELARLTHTLSRKRDKSLTFGQDTLRQTLKLLHERCDLLIAVSEKSARLIKPYSGGAPIKTIPTGVDALKVNERDRLQWRARWKATNDTVVYIYAGRLSKEKKYRITASLIYKAHSHSA